MLIFELLDDHREALKKKDDEVVDLRWSMEFSAAAKTATKKVSLDCEAVVCSNREELE